MGAGLRGARRAHDCCSLDSLGGEPARAPQRRVPRHAPARLTSNSTPSGISNRRLISCWKATRPSSPGRTGTRCTTWPSVTTITGSTGPATGCWLEVGAQGCASRAGASAAFQSCSSAAQKRQCRSSLRTGRGGWQVKGAGGAVCRCRAQQAVCFSEGVGNTEAVCAVCEQRERPPPPRPHRLTSCPQTAAATLQGSGGAPGGGGTCTGARAAPRSPRRGLRAHAAVQRRRRDARIVQHQLFLASVCCVQGKQAIAREANSWARRRCKHVLAQGRRLQAGCSTHISSSSPRRCRGCALLWARR